jgi:helix-turn-helix protein
LQPSKQPASFISIESDAKWKCCIKDKGGHKEAISENGTNTKKLLVVEHVSAASHSTTGNAEEMLDGIYCATIATIIGTIIQ